MVPFVSPEQAIREITDSETYEALWRASGFSPLQAWAWGEVKRPAWTPHRLAIGTTPFQLLVRRALFGPFGYAPRALSNSTANTTTLKALAAYARDTLHLTHLIIDPEAWDSYARTNFEEAGFEDWGKTIQPNCTDIVSLRNTEDEIFMRFRESTRKKIRKAEKLGCAAETLATNDARAIDRFYPVMEDIVRHTAYITHDKEYFEKIWDAFAGSGMAHIVMLTKNNKDVGGLLYLDSARTAYELYGGVLDSAKHDMGNYFLKWQGMRAAKQRGREHYDQWGVARRTVQGFDPQDPLYAISLFKENFGGEHREFLYQQVAIFNWACHFAYRASITGGALLLQLKKLLKRR